MLLFKKFEIVFVAIIVCCGFLIYSNAQVHPEQRAQPPEIRDGGNYKIRNVANKNFLTVVEQGIVGLRTGLVATMPNTEAMTQGWTLTWEPLRSKHQGYWIQSRHEYLNTVTAFYPPGRTLAELNVWKVKYYGDEKFQIQNARTNLCLQVGTSGKKGKIDSNLVSEGECLNSGHKEESRQRWNLIRVIVVPEEEEISFRREVISE